MIRNCDLDFSSNVEEKKKFEEILEISLEVRMCIIYLNQCISHGLNPRFEFLYDFNFKFICP